MQSIQWSTNAFIRSVSVLLNPHRNLASTGIPYITNMGPLAADAKEATKVDTISDYEPKCAIADEEPADCSNGEIVQSPEALQRRLTPRQIQFIAIGGSIGTALFVTIGYALMRGAGSLFIAFTLHSLMMAQVNNALAEMTVFMPISAAFVQHAATWVDSAWGFMAGWNFFLYEGLNIPFEITAVDMVLTFWRDDIPAAAVISACLVLYAYVLLLFPPECRVYPC